MQTEKNTFSKFGGLIAGTEYTIDQAVEDGAVVPLVYEGRYTETEVNNRPLVQLGKNNPPVTYDL